MGKKSKTTTNKNKKKKQAQSNQNEENSRYRPRDYELQRRKLAARFAKGDSVVTGKEIMIMVLLTSKCMNSTLERAAPVTSRYFGFPINIIVQQVHKVAAMTSDEQDKLLQEAMSQEAVEIQIDYTKLLETIEDFVALKSGTEPPFGTTFDHLENNYFFQDDYL